MPADATAWSFRSDEVLLTDDEGLVRECVAESVTYLGHDVEGTGSAALKLSPSLRPGF
ncbi:MAG: hypothetical protein U1G07_19865 [Verrucomicrobiota bacterium]